MYKNLPKIGSVFTFVLLSFLVAGPGQKHIYASDSPSSHDCDELEISHSPSPRSHDLDDDEDCAPDPDVTPPTVTLAAVAATSGSATIYFTVSGNEPIDCSTLSSVIGVDFAVTNISAITNIVQTSSTVCTITALSTAVAGGGPVTSTLTQSGSFSISDSSGNAQTALGSAPQSTLVTIPAIEPSGGGPAPTAAPSPISTPSTTIAPAIALPTRGSAALKKSLKAQVFFGLRSAELTPAAKLILKGVASKVSKATEISVEIVGAVQESKNVPNVSPLSTNRANAVRDYLRSLKVNGTYTIKIIGIIGDTPAARRATLSVFYS